MSDKGQSFEREICTSLSLWVTGGKRRDVFWRSSMSGGRATVRQGSVRQSGDICSVAPEGHVLTDPMFVELKHYKSLNLGGFLYGVGELANFWSHAVKQAGKHNKTPALIARQNFKPTILITVHAGPFFTSATEAGINEVWFRRDRPPQCVLYLLDNLLAVPFRVAAIPTRVRLT